LESTNAGPNHSDFLCELQQLRKVLLSMTLLIKRRRGRTARRTAKPFGPTSEFGPLQEANVLRGTLLGWKRHSPLVGEDGELLFTE
jgi:hypothetical protein